MNIERIHAQKDEIDLTTKTSYAEKSPIKLFLFSTLGSLLITVGAMILINTKMGLAGEKAGNLGGVFQGTVGVAAAVAGAIVTIVLAKIAIDLGKRSNAIASRQADNDDPIHTKATEIALSRYELISAINAIQYNICMLTKMTGVLKQKKTINIRNQYNNNEDIILNINGKDYLLNKKNNLQEEKAYEIIDKHVSHEVGLYSEALTKSMFGRIKADISRILILLTPVILQYSAMHNSKLGTKWLSACIGVNFAMDGIESNNTTIRIQAIGNLFNSAETIDSIITNQYLADIKNIRLLISSVLREHNESIPEDLKDQINDLRAQIYEVYGTPNSNQ